jgi:hypothetical protein
MREEVVRVELELKEIATVEGKLEITTMVKVKTAMPQQDERLPYEIAI